MSDLNLINFPNSITLIRVTLIPVFVVVYCLPINYHHEMAAFVFTVASLTDWLDGFLARKLKQETRFGAFCDPVADKLIVIIALMLLLGAYNTLWITVPAIIIVSREIIISGLREWVAGQGKSGILAVSYAAKVKTMAQMASIIVLLSQKPTLGLVLVQLGVVLLLFAAILTVWTMSTYFYRVWPTLLGK